MTKAAFDKIAAGLNDAMNHARVTNQDEEAVALLERFAKRSIINGGVEFVRKSEAVAAVAAVVRTPPASDVSEAMVEAGKEAAILLDAVGATPQAYRVELTAIYRAMQAASTPEQET